MLTEILISAKIVYRKGVTVKQRFALVKDNSKKQPNFGWCGCFFDVFYFSGLPDTDYRDDDADDRHYNTDKLQNHSEHQ